MDVPKNKQLSKNKILYVLVNLIYIYCDPNKIKIMKGIFFGSFSENIVLKYSSTP